MTKFKFLTSSARYVKTPKNEPIEQMDTWEITHTNKCSTKMRNIQLQRDPTSRIPRSVEHGRPNQIHQRRNRPTMQVLAIILPNQSNQENQLITTSRGFLNFLFYFCKKVRFWLLGGEEVRWASRGRGRARRRRCGGRWGRGSWRSCGGENWRRGILRLLKISSLLLNPWSFERERERERFGGGRFQINFDGSSQDTEARAISKRAPHIILCAPHPLVKWFTTKGK